MTVLAITITALGFLKFWLVFGLVADVIGFIWTCVDGPIEFGPATFLISTFISITLVLCVFSL